MSAKDDATPNTGVIHARIAERLFESRTVWFLAALAGVVVGAVWNYAATQLYTWGRKGASAGA